MKRILLLAIVVLLGLKSYACTCLPERELWGFCQVLQHAKNQSMFCVVKAKVVSFYHWGMYVEVLDNIYDAAGKDTILVWGDCGACCRPGLQGQMALQPNDTLVMSLERTDLMGNFIMPQQPDYEDSNDYVLQGCGVYYMRYHSGNVIGWFYNNTSPVPDTISYAQFKQEVTNCISPTGIGQTNNNAISVTVYPNPATAEVYIHAQTVITTIQLYNSIGQVIHSSSPGNKHTRINMDPLPAGMYTLVLYDADRREFHRQKLQRE